MWVHNVVIQIMNVGTQCSYPENVCRYIMLVIQRMNVAKVYVPTLQVPWVKRLI